jgi:predicted MPP superfamily phosphohydrolase
VYYAFQPAIIRKVHIPIENLAKSFDGFRIIQLCDIHLGPTVGKAQLEEVIDAVQTLHPGNHIGAIDDHDYEELISIILKSTRGTCISV